MKPTSNISPFLGIRQIVTGMYLMGCAPLLVLAEGGGGRGGANFLIKIFISKGNCKKKSKKETK
jgi:hypothetical protein